MITKRILRHINPTRAKIKRLKSLKQPSTKNISEIPTLKEFMTKNSLQGDILEGHTHKIHPGVENLKFYLQTYGCQMNTADSEIVSAILQGCGMEQTTELNEAELVLLNTCAIREGAEKKIWHRLDFINSLNKNKNGNGRIVGILGCMAERLKEKLVERKKVVDLVVGPDAYRDIPRLVSNLLVKIKILFELVSG